MASSSNRDAYIRLSCIIPELNSFIRSSTIPFPPVIFASGFASLIAQTYISSHPAHGLFLISPPISNASVPPHLNLGDLPEFDFEPNFPLAIMDHPIRMKLLLAENRLARSECVDLFPVTNRDSSEAIEKMQLWLDELGI
ncbi:hypothetical protein BJ138DRAFT_1141995 [Hygrophoropsis aurantiaca]|uniref:Uncharacterized protein n=1 Tax=Hygrophoropsis aurantiaca TaxID=72124 RepID=A0ACB8AQZ8_9AGAM|nr:hypothetical protein BJ138DRAFT_1141995 [Hygrophoropsis aurantiaca]